MHDHTSSHLFECKSLPTSLSSLDLWTNPDKVEPFLATWGRDCWLPHDFGCWTLLAARWWSGVDNNNNSISIQPLSANHKKTLNLQFLSLPMQFQLKFKHLCVFKFAIRISWYRNVFSYLLNLIPPNNIVCFNRKLLNMSRIISHNSRNDHAVFISLCTLMWISAT